MDMRSVVAETAYGGETTSSFCPQLMAVPKSARHQKHRTPPLIDTERKKLLN